MFELWLFLCFPFYFIVDKLVAGSEIIRLSHLDGARLRPCSQCCLLPAACILVSVAPRCWQPLSKADQCLLARPLPR